MVIWNGRAPGVGVRGSGQGRRKSQCQAFCVSPLRAIYGRGWDVPLLGTPCPLRPTDVARSKLPLQCLLRGPSCFQQSSEYLFFCCFLKKESISASGLGTKSRGKARWPNTQQEGHNDPSPWWRQLGDLGHCFHLSRSRQLVPASVLPPGLGTHPRWSAEGAASTPETAPLASHWPQAVGGK